MDENPTVVPGIREPGAKKRIPLSAPQRKLEVADIPGYHLRWIKGTPQRLAQAERAGFEFVEESEIELNDTLLSAEGSTDMGSRVSVIEGGEVDPQGQAVRLYLMKQKLEYFNEDSALLQDRNDSVVDALTAQYSQGQIGGRAQGETAEDAKLRYVDPRRSKVPELFRKKNR